MSLLGNAGMTGGARGGLDRNNAYVSSRFGSHRSKCGRKMTIILWLAGWKCIGCHSTHSVLQRDARWCVYCSLCGEQSGERGDDDAWHQPLAGASGQRVAGPAMTTATPSTRSVGRNGIVDPSWNVLDALPLSPTAHHQILFKVAAATPSLFAWCCMDVH